jgi:2-octaprenyl-6-methoxyphenol hydroxylase
MKSRQRTKSYPSQSALVVAGGGIAALTLACLVAQSPVFRNKKIILIDPQGFDETIASSPQGRTVALMESSLTLLKQAGIDIHQDVYREDLKHLRLIDTSQKPNFLDRTFSAQELGHSKFGTNLSLKTLQALANQAAQKHPSIELIQDKIKHIAKTDNGLLVTTESDMSIPCALLIGADGRHSKVRSFADISVIETDYQQIAMTGLVRHQYAHDHTSIEFHKEGGPLTFVPLASPQNSSEHFSSFVWVERTQQAQKILSCNANDLNKILENLSAGLLGSLELQSYIQSWPLKKLRAKNYTAPHIALMAEAAHVISPIGAQGLNLSLRDADSLAYHILDGLSLGLELGSVAMLTPYNIDRQHDINLRVFSTDILNQFVKSDNKIIQLLRRSGFKIFSDFGVLRQIIMQEGFQPHIFNSTSKATRREQHAQQ